MQSTIVDLPVHAPPNSEQLELLLNLQRSLLEKITVEIEIQEILDELCTFIEEMVPESVASVMLLDQLENTLHVHAAPSVPVAAIKALNGLKPGYRAGSCGNAVLDSKPVFVCDTLSDERWADLKTVAEDFGIRACWSIPILGSDGLAVGSFAISSFEKRNPSGFFMRLLQTSAYLAGIALQREESHRRLHMAGMVFENTQEGIMVTDEQMRILEVNNAFTRVTGYSLEEVCGKTPRVLSSGRHTKDYYQAMWQSINEVGFWEGEIWNRRKNGEIYPELLSITRVEDPKTGELRFLGVFSDISRIKRSEERLAYLAHHDPLTSLPNRLMLGARMEHTLERVERQGSLVGVMFLDLDRFKNINDTLGHELGDGLLVQVAERLKQMVRTEDTVARLGGDEFIIIIGGVQTQDATVNIAQQILNRLAEPYVLEEREFYFTASIGISHFPVDGTDQESLLRMADTALYKAKEQGRNTYMLYSPDHTRQVEDWLELESYLRAALDLEEFVVHYQPKISTETGKCTGVEALVRWNHPELGQIPPNRFIPIAEEIGMISRLGEWVMRTACLQVGKWREQGVNLTVSVNLSGQQIMMSDLATRVETILSETGLLPEYLELEILESFVMRHAEESINTLRQVRELGVQLSIDDFGSGYSSLSYLKRLPISKLKIDQSLVMDIPDDANDVAITQAVIALGQSMDLKVCAEGVETDEQRKFLCQQGVDELQGYFFSRPVPAEQIPALVLTD